MVHCGFQQLPDTKLSLHALGCPVWASLAWICLCVLGLHVFLSFALLSLGLSGMCKRVAPALLSAREVQPPNFGSGERDGCDGVLSELFTLFQLA